MGGCGKKNIQLDMNKLHNLEKSVFYLSNINFNNILYSIPLDVLFIIHSYLVINLEMLFTV